MASKGKGKRSASVARLDNHEAPTSAPDDAASQLNDVPFEQESKRPCYPDPSPYQDMSHPHAPLGYDFNQPNYFDNQPQFDLFGQPSGFNNNLGQQYGNYNPMNFQPTSSPFPYNSTPIASPFSAGNSFGAPLANNLLGQPQNSGHPDPKPKVKTSHSLALPKPETSSPSTATGLTIASSSSPPKATPPVTRSRTRNGAPRTPGTLRVGGAPIEDAGLKIPNGISEAESLRRKGELLLDIENQRQNPPALPRSRIVDLEEKPRHAPWHDIPEDCAGKDRERLVQLNNDIARQNQKIERDRNNQAAKKSRQKRLEALNDTRKILNEKSAECDWWRMRAMTMGASVKEWEQVPRQIKAAMVKEISDRVDVVHQCHEEEKKKEDAIKRTERNKARSAQRAAKNGTPTSSS